MLVKRQPRAGEVIEYVNNWLSNVGIWESIEAANHMATFQPMLDLAGKFVALETYLAAGENATGGVCNSARSSAGPVWRLKLSALLIRPT